MERYNYKTALYNDMLSYIEDNVNLADYDNKEEAYNALDEMMWVEDYITGNGSYGYADEEECEKYVGDNLKLAFEALREFCIKLRDIPDTSPAKYMDSTIRCYLFHGVLQQVVDEIYDSKTVN